MTNLVAIVLNVQMLTKKSISSGDLTYLDSRDTLRMRQLIWKTFSVRNYDEIFFVDLSLFLIVIDRVADLFLFRNYLIVIALS